MCLPMGCIVSIFDVGSRGTGFTQVKNGGGGGAGGGGRGGCCAGGSDALGLLRCGCACHFEHSVKYIARAQELYVGPGRTNINVTCHADSCRITAVQ
jgi:hypothetical protein